MNRNMRWIGTVFLVAFALCGAALPAHGQDREVPYWASLRADEVNMRRGPSANYPIARVYVRKGLPVKVIRVVEGWRLIRDPDGAQGWVTSRLLAPERSAMVIGKGVAAIRAEPREDAAIRWKAQPGVIGKLERCEDGWCELDIRGHRGWVKASRLWGAN